MPEFLIDVISARFEPQGPVGRLGTLVLDLDVEPQADHVARRQGVLSDRRVQGTKHTAASRLGNDVDALKPPDPTVAPVAPLATDRGLADEDAVPLGQPVAQSFRVGQRGGHATFQDRAIKRFPLGLQGQPAVEFDDRDTVLRAAERIASAAPSAGL